ncbi:Serine/threonine-protein kinase D3-like 2 [Homarus americanus]|uniref:Serine/threonine-protein kinase D3-like 2 n=1 Tax=Homarus americanus TaxID=6706 RepID=A0A8J5JLZ3_HOMAM|nr:Serine/threonine-protein kinase D3-like 2 [Homarus americanus]
MAKSLQQIHNKGVVHCDLKPQDVLVVPAETMQVNIVDYGHARFLGQDLQLGPEPSSVRLASPTTDIYDLGKIMSSIFHEIGEEWPTKLLEVKQTIFSSDPKVRPNLEKIIKDVENCLEETIETLTPVTNPVEDIKDVENCLEETIETLPLSPIRRGYKDVEIVSRQLRLLPGHQSRRGYKDENCLEETIETLTPVTNPVEDIKDVEKCLEETIETLPRCRGGSPMENPYLLGLKGSCGLEETLESRVGQGSPKPPTNRTAWAREQPKQQELQPKKPPTNRTALAREQPKQQELQPKKPPTNRTAWAREQPKQQELQPKKPPTNRTALAREQPKQQELQPKKPPTNRTALAREQPKQQELQPKKPPTNRTAWAREQPKQQELQPKKPPTNRTAWAREQPKQQELQPKKPPTNRTALAREQPKQQELQPKKPPTNRTALAREQPKQQELQPKKPPTNRTALENRQQPGTIPGTSLCCPSDVLVVPAETMQVNIVDYGHARFLGQDLQLGPEPSSVRLASPTTDIYDLGKIMSSIFHEIGEEWPTKLLEVKQTIFSSDPKVRPNLEKIIKDVENCLEETIETLTPVTNPVEDIKDVENCLEETIETLTPVTNPVEDIKDVENCLEETIETLTPVTNPVEDIKDVEKCLEETIETLTPVTNPVYDIKDVEKCRGGSPMENPYLLGLKGSCGLEETLESRVGQGSPNNLNNRSFSPRNHPPTEQPWPENNLTTRAPAQETTSTNRTALAREQPKQQEPKPKKPPTNRTAWASEQPKQQELQPKKTTPPTELPGPENNLNNKSSSPRKPPTNRTALATENNLNKQELQPKKPPTNRTVFGQRTT